MAKIDETLRTRIVSGGLSLILLVTGFGLGKLDSKRNDNIKDNYLEDYIAKREELEQEIASLSEAKDKLEDIKNYRCDKLIVIEHLNEYNETELYILVPDRVGYYYDYQTEIQAHHDASCSYKKHLGWIHFTEFQPLFDYLTEEERNILKDNDGEFSTLELDNILARIRFEYHQQKEKESYTRSLIK